MKKLNLRETQQATLAVLDKIDEICKAASINYFIVLGSLIGAIRHNGFIPWDDDLDVAMPREDYERFIDYCISNKGKMDGFSLLHYKTNKKYVYPIARFTKNDDYIAVEEKIRSYGLGIFVDIYPIDGQNPSDAKQLKKINKYGNIISTFFAYKKCPDSKNKFKFFIKQIVFCFCKLFNPYIFIKKLDKIAKKYKLKAVLEKRSIYWKDPKVCQDITDEVIKALNSGK